MIAGLPSSIQFPTIAMPCIRASWGVMKVRLQVYLVNSSLLRSTQLVYQRKTCWLCRNELAE